MFTLRNGISWDLISCSTILIVLLSEVMSFSKSSILSFIICLFWSFSCFSMESLDASSSRRNWCSASNSSRICLSVFSAWLCNENVIICFPEMENSLALSIIVWFNNANSRWKYLNMIYCLLTSEFCFSEELQFFLKWFQSIYEFLLNTNDNTKKS